MEIKYCRWTIIKKIKNKPTKVLCKCECGTEKEVFLNNLKSGLSKSCGCLRDENVSKKNRKITIIPGEKYSYWTTIKEVKPHNGLVNRKVLCKCDCGKEKEVFLSSLRSGLSKSCGCSTRIYTDTNIRSKHYYLYVTWNGMRKRCLNLKSNNYKNYGGRGIKIYKQWIDDYFKFKNWILNNLGERPEGMSLDRINNDGNYVPGNLRWATRKQQVQNSRTVIKNDSK